VRDGTKLDFIFALSSLLPPEKCDVPQIGCVHDLTLG
jgi:hypothetical protein